MLLISALKSNLFTYLFFGKVVFLLSESAGRCTIVFLLALTELNKVYC